MPRWPNAKCRQYPLTLQCCYCDHSLVAEDENHHELQMDRMTRHIAQDHPRRRA